MTHKQLLDELCSPFVHQISSSITMAFSSLVCLYVNVRPRFNSGNIWSKQHFFVYFIPAAGRYDRWCQASRGHFFSSPSLMTSCWMRISFGQQPRELTKFCFEPVYAGSKNTLITCTYKRKHSIKLSSRRNFLHWNTPPKNFVRTESTMTHCMICFAETPDRISRTLCCSGVICLSCLEAHIVSKINEAIVAIICPLGNCDSLVSEEEIRQLVPDEVFEKYERFKVEVEQNPGIKICPGCSRIYQHPDLEKVEREKVSRPEVMKVTCSKCRLVWCFACQAPWHHGLTCNEFCKGDKSLKIWAKNRGQPARNACRCPKCHVFIQKSSGCDHMCCSRWES